MKEWSLKRSRLLTKLLVNAFATKDRVFEPFERRRLGGARRKQLNLNAFESRVTSQNGEDGILREIFSRIPHRRYFVEIGVEDGSQCNSALLVSDYHWHGLVVEGDDRYADALKARFRDRQVSVAHAYVDRGNIVEIFREHDVPSEFDLLSIDIDGNDYFLWEATKAYHPSVVVIEYNAFFGNERSCTIAYDKTHRYRADTYFGASLAALAKLGNGLGYELIGTNRTGTNAFFIRNELVDICGFRPKLVREAFHAKPLLGQLLPKGTGPLVEI